MNFRLTLQYDGTEFHGWQMQVSSQRTVQGELTRVLSLIEGRAVVIHGAGRTDAGVHAESQIANVHMNRMMTPQQLQAAINGNLARDVRVVRAEVVADDFHARFSAQGKTYCYRVFNAPFASPFWMRYAHTEVRPLDIGRMQQAALLFLGEHDWTAFSAVHTDVRTRVRTMTKLEVTEHWSAFGQGSLIEIVASADGFLRYMVRSIAGTLLAVGLGKMNEEQIKQAIASGIRALAGPTAPACGLTLKQVHYSTDEGGQMLGVGSSELTSDL